MQGPHMLVKYVNCTFILLYYYSNYFLLACILRLIMQVQFCLVYELAYLVLADSVHAGGICNCACVCVFVCLCVNSLCVYFLYQNAP